MNSLLNNLDKRPFQVYTIEHGIERFKVAVPLAEVRAFEKAFAEAIDDGNDSKTDLLEVLKLFGGKLKTVEA
jgi:hypothetical protein